MNRALLVFGLGLLAAACNVNPYDLGATGDDGGQPNGDARADGGGPIGEDAGADAGIDATMCVPSPEICNMQNDDCDEGVDEDFHLDIDPSNCGTCGNRCMYTNAFGVCENGECQVGACRSGYVDLTPLTPGCDYACIPTNGSVEECDNRDNDCDNLVDETFDRSADVNNCGTCGNICNLLHTDEAGCDNGVCVVESCDSGFADINPNIPGCEYRCPNSLGAETCNGVDDDCDGRVDEAPLDIGITCSLTSGVCVAGTPACRNGVPVCEDRELGQVEVCAGDGQDEDCDGRTDEGFNPQTNPLYCNNCEGCNQFSIDHHTIAQCVAGTCTGGTCTSGWVNADNNLANGCEYQCTPSGVEICDGQDNDCDGLRDEGLTAPTNFCRTLGECDDTRPTCAGAAGWTCRYPTTVEVIDGDIVVEETLCDGLDNDCDGDEDEVFPLKGTACAEDGTFETRRKLGTCRGTGSLVCNSNNDGLSCNVTTAGATAGNETCNNRDDDCDGHTDEPYDYSSTLGVRDVTVGPVAVNGRDIVMYRYEASRPDSTSGSAGFVETRSCSVSNRMPWAGGDYDEARNACRAAGMRLCQVTRNGQGLVTADEWGRFCEGSANRTFPYGNTYSGTACNGAEYDPLPGGSNQDQAIATGSLATCTSANLSLDQSGNLKEWVDDARTVGGQSVRTLRGGSFDNFEHGLTCDFDLTVVPTSYRFSNTGFRCCALSCAAGQSECNNACVNLASDSANCGACGVTCGIGNTCSNGYCCPTGTRACGDLCVATGTSCP